jgi:hypothetical protein
MHKPHRGVYISAMRDETVSGHTGHMLEVRDFEWSVGIGHPAGIYWLGGRSVIAALGSPAEQRLLDQGAVPIATLIFERDPHDGTRSGHVVDRLSMREMHEVIAEPFGN